MTYDSTAHGKPNGGIAPGGSATVAEIRSQIEQTRAGMSETIDAIETRLKPGRLITDASRTVKDAAVRRARSFAQRARSEADALRSAPPDPQRIIQAIRRNPIPLVLISLAATALVLRAWRSSR